MCKNREVNREAFYVTATILVVIIMLYYNKYLAFKYYLPCSLSGQFSKKFL